VLTRLCTRGSFPNSSYSHDDRRLAGRQSALRCNCTIRLTIDKANASTGVPTGAFEGLLPKMDAADMRGSLSLAAEATLMWTSWIVAREVRAAIGFGLNNVLLEVSLTRERAVLRDAVLSRVWEGSTKGEWVM
jgi:hypothetical protein